MKRSGPVNWPANIMQLRFDNILFSIQSLNRILFAGADDDDTIVKSFDAFENKGKIDADL